MTTWTQFCPFLTTTYLYVDIFNPKRGQKWHLLDHLPPLLVHVVIERPSLTFFYLFRNFEIGVKPNNRE